MEAEEGSLVRESGRGIDCGLWRLATIAKARRNLGPWRIAEEDWRSRGDLPLEDEEGWRRRSTGGVEGEDLLARRPSPSPLARRWEAGMPDRVPRWTVDKE